MPTHLMTTQKVGRPRKHKPDAVTCLVRIPKPLMEQLDKIGPTRQAAILAAVERGMAIYRLLQ
jgi:hypothetical protein